MKKLKVKQRVILSTGFLVLFLLVISFGIILPTLRYIDNLKENIELTETEIEESYQKINSLKNSINQLNEIKGKVEPFYFLTLNEGDELVIIKLLESVATQNNVAQSLGVVYNESGSGDKNSLTNKPHYVFKIKVVGEYIDILNYLDDLEELPYYFLLDQITIGREKSQANNTVSANFSVILNSTTNFYNSLE